MSVIAGPPAALPEELDAGRLRARVLQVGGVIAVLGAAVAVAPGLGDLRHRFAGASPGWLAAGALFELLSCAAYVTAFRGTFCGRMSWGTSWSIGAAEVGANALFPAGMAGGLALGAWVLRRGGMAAERVARLTVAFFLLTSLPNVALVALVGAGLAAGALPGDVDPALALVPAAVATVVIGAFVALPALAARYGRRRTGRVPRRRSRAVRAVLVAAATIPGGVREALRLLRRPRPLLVLGLAGYLLFDIAALWAAFRAMGGAPTLAPLALAYLLGQLGGLIPIPGGVGGVDGGLVAALMVYGAPVASAAAAVLVYRGLTFVVPGALGAQGVCSLRRRLRAGGPDLVPCATA